MDPRKVAIVAQAFQTAKIDVQDIPETVAAIVVLYAKEIAKQSDRDGDTLVFMTIDQILTKWQPIRSAEPTTDCALCLANHSAHVPADVWIVARKEGGTGRLAVCENHAGPARDEAIKEGADVTLERIRR